MPIPDNIYNIPISVVLPKTPEPIPNSNPIHKADKLLEAQNVKIDNLSNELEQSNLELQSIHYENMKLNAQIDVLNKAVDFQNDELERLRNINAELKISNQSLKENNNHYWRNTFIVGFAAALIFFLLGLIIP